MSSTVLAQRLHGAVQRARGQGAYNSRNFRMYANLPRLVCVCEQPSTFMPNTDTFLVLTPDLLLVLAINVSLYYFSCTRTSACNSFHIWPLLSSRPVTSFIFVTRSNSLATSPQPSEGTLCNPDFPAGGKLPFPLSKQRGSQSQCSR